MSKRKPFALRVNEEILSAMQKWADDELRSVNGQIEYVLREALKQVSRLPGNKSDRKKNP
ncbi:MAG: Arc family DNA-binding protein [Gammaproteobacteria bacterium]|nr:Arc family DNA-binding protein [Gammaproteobacteria bacterium]